MKKFITHMVRFWGEGKVGHRGDHREKGLVCCLWWLLVAVGESTLALQELASLQLLTCTKGFLISFARHEVKGEEKGENEILSRNIKTGIRIFIQAFLSITREENNHIQNFLQVIHHSSLIISVRYFDEGELEK